MFLGVLYHFPFKSFRIAQRCHMFRRRPFESTWKLASSSLSTKLFTRIVDIICLHCAVLHCSFPSCFFQHALHAKNFNAMNLVCDFSIKFQSWRSNSGAHLWQHPIHIFTPVLAQPSRDIAPAGTEVKDVITGFQPRPETQDVKNLFMSFLRSAPRLFFLAVPDVEMRLRQVHVLLLLIQRFHHEPGPVQKRFR